MKKQEIAINSFISREIWIEIFKMAGSKTLADARLWAKFYNDLIVEKIYKDKHNYLADIQAKIKDFANLHFFSYKDKTSDKALHITYGNFVEQCRGLKELTPELREKFIAILNKGVVLTDPLIERTKLISPACEKVIQEHLVLLKYEFISLLIKDQFTSELANPKQNKIAINVRNNYGETLLANAIMRQDIDKIKILLTKATWSDLQFEDMYGHNLLYWLAHSPYVIDRLTKELEKFAEIKLELERIKKDVTDNKELKKFDISQPVTAIAYLMLRNTTLNNTNLEIPDHVELYYLKGKNLINGINIRNDDGNTALHLAAKNGLVDQIRELLDQGADINAKNNFGYTALDYAFKLGSMEIAKLLLDQGADINTKNYLGNTLLYDAVIEGNIDRVQKLLSKKGIDINAEDNNRYTALDTAEYYGHYSIVRAIQEHLGKSNPTGLSIGM